jgi:hypothetical protein
MQWSELLTYKSGFGSNSTAHTLNAAKYQIGCPTSKEKLSTDDKPSNIAANAIDFGETKW